MRKQEAGKLRRPECGEMVVTLINAERFPQHGTESPEAKAKWSEWRGKKIIVYATPFPAREGWNCGAKELYLVPDREVARILGREPLFGSYYVCKHQIEPLRRKATQQTAPQRGKKRG